MTKLPELLAPAGSPEALAAAIEAGADAVYFGGELFSNRMRARNFTDGELELAIHTCAAYGVRSYITMNTRLRDRELPAALAAARRLYEAGADAFIVADVGLAALMRRAFPSAELHASTQMTCVNSLDGAAAKSLGISRLVCPRELSLREVTRLAAESPVEIEMFIHGAHCVSLSGQCLMSWAMGGRSGNRGECAQPCRLPYRCSAFRGTSTKTHPLSLKDMCLATHIPEIIDSGVASLKIEGRLKSAGYVYGVTRIYRTLLDEKRPATDIEIAQLDSLFSRDGFTDGYFREDFRRMTGTRAENAVSAGDSFGGLTKKVSLSATVTLKAGERATLTLNDGFISVTAEGDVVEEAKNAPITPQNVYKSISKLGGTPYTLPPENFEYITEGQVFKAASRLNELRRAAVAMLVEEHKNSIRRHDTVESELLVHGSEAVREEEQTEKLTTASFTVAGKVPREALEYFDIIFLPYRETLRLGVSGRAEVGLKLSPWTPDSDAVRRELYAFREAGGRHVLCHTLGHIAATVEAGLIPIASFRLNVTSSEAARVIYRMGAAYTVMSPEPNAAAVRDVCAEVPSAGAVVYGKLPIMLLRRCIMSDYRCSGKCGEAGCLLPVDISDRRGIKLEVLPTGDRTNTVLNPNPVYMADRAEQTRSFGIKHFIFSVESAEECRRVIDAYKYGISPKDMGIGQIKRL